MTVATIDDNHPARALAFPTIDAGLSTIERLSQWVEAAAAAERLVTPMVHTPFVPDAYRPKVDPRASQEDKDRAVEIAIASATAAVLFGSALGFDPLTALQQVTVIKGRPGMYAKAKVALVVSHGHEVWTEKLTDDEVTVCGRRRGSEHIERVTTTFAEAKRAGWTTNEAYGKTPRDMLYARTAGRVCDRIAPDVLLGIGTAEDLRDLDDTIRVTATAGQAEQPALTAADIIATTAGPDGPPAPPAVPAVEQTEPKAGDGALKRMFSLLGSTGLADKDAALAYISDLIERPITSRNELTAGEVSQVIAALEVRANTAN